MKLIAGILSIIIFVGLPCFLVFKLYKLLAGNITFSQEQKRELHELRKKIMTAQYIKLTQETEFYKQANDYGSARSHSKGGVSNGGYQKRDNRNAQSSPR